MTQNARGVTRSARRNKGRSDKEKSNPAQKGLFRRYAEAFSEDFFQ